MTTSKAAGSVAKLRAVNVRDPRWGARGDGVTDDAAAILAALTYAWENSMALYFPDGEYLVGSQIRQGMTGALYATPLTIIGTRLSTIKVTATIDGAFKFEGPVPETDTGNDRLAGRITIQGLRFRGPERYGGAKLGRALYFYGAQGVVLDNVGIYGFSEGVMYHNVDLVTHSNGTQIQNCNTGVETANSGYAAGGQLNSFVTTGCWYNNCSTYGINYKGGNKPVIVGNNFSANGTSLNIGNTSEAGANVESPTVTDNYFESDTASMIILGGNAGIVSGGNISNNSMLPSAGTTAITVGNVQSRAPGGPPRIYDNNMVGAGYTEIDQSTSVSKADYRNGFMQVKPSFHATVFPTINNVTGGGTAYSIIFNIERNDPLGNFSAVTGLFTAPFTGLYCFEWGVGISDVAVGNTDATLALNISGGSDYDVTTRFNPTAEAGVGTNIVKTGSATVYMVAGQTAGLVLTIQGAADSCDITATPYSWFSGRMVSGT